MAFYTSYVSSGAAFDACNSVRSSPGTFSAQELTKVDNLLGNVHRISAIRCARTPVSPTGKVFVVEYEYGHINCS